MPGKGRHIRLGTRGSALARWQADWAAGTLRAQGVAVEIVPITTQGDITSGPLGATGQTGLFTKEIQRALLDQRIDLAVHSLKDLPTDPVPGLQLAAVPERASSFDVLVSNQFESLEALPSSACIGTGSKRRLAQLRFLRPDLDIRDIRGNVDTRLKKLDTDEFQAIVLAQAGLQRLGLAHRISFSLQPPLLYPAVGQGALGLETRADDPMTTNLVRELDHPPSHAAVLAERAMLRDLRGGCLAPVGVWTRVNGEELDLEGVVLSHDGTQRIVSRQRGHSQAAEELGIRVARDLVNQGALDLIRASRS